MARASFSTSWTRISAPAARRPAPLHATRTLYTPAAQTERHKSDAEVVAGRARRAPGVQSLIIWGDGAGQRPRSGQAAR
jgi:hypothetical protein